MGHRHNRRRTRPRSRSQNSTTQQDSSSSPATGFLPLPLALAPPPPWSPQPTYCEPVPVNSSSKSSAACILHGSPVPAALAPTWHHGCTGWLSRESTPSPPPETAGLEEAQCRLFGGAPGDDVNLCYRMLEYFGGLDYIDSMSNSLLGD